MRGFLTVRETAFLLQKSEMVIRRMIDTSQLACLGEWETSDGRARRRISPESIREHFPDDGSYQLRRLAMGAILAGRFTVSAPANRWGPPAPLSIVVDVVSAAVWPAGGRPLSQQLIEHQAAELLPTPG